MQLGGDDAEFQARALLLEQEKKKKADRNKNKQAKTAAALAASDAEKATTTKPKKSPRFIWTDKLATHYVEALGQEHIHFGHMNDGSGFKAEAWTRILEAFTRTARAELNGKLVERQVLQSKYDSLKKEYASVNFLLNLSGLGLGFAWNSTLKRISKKGKYFKSSAIRVCRGVSIEGGKNRTS